MITIEYFYSAHSAYAYIGHKRLLEICAQYGCDLVHRPFELSPAVEASGAVPFAERSAQHNDYYFGREIERWSEVRQVEILSHSPTHHDTPYHLANGVLIAAIQQGLNVDDLSYEILRAHWRDDLDLSDPEQLGSLVSRVLPELSPVADMALSEPVQAQNKANTVEAIERGVFGSPTYFLDGDMYYGQDHLELLERALQKPFRPHSFRSM